MTRTTSPIKDGPYSGDGSTDSFAWTFLIDADDEINVYYENSSGTETLVSSANYDLTYTAGTAGGTVTYPNSGSGLAKLQTGEKLTLLMDKDYEQQKIDTTSQDTISPATFEDTVDYLTDLIKQNNEKLGRVPQDNVSGASVDFDSVIADLAALTASVTAAAASATSAQAAANQALSIVGSTFGSSTTAVSSSPYTVTSSDRGTVLQVDTSGGDVTINMLSVATATDGWNVAIQKTTNDANDVIVARDGTDTINSVAGNYTISSFKELVAFIADTDASPDDWAVVNFGLQNGDKVVERFVKTTNFTPGTTTDITLTNDPGSAANAQVFFDGMYVESDLWSLTATPSIQFDSAIPAGTNAIEVHVGTALPVGTVGTGSITTAMLADLSVTTAKLAADAVTGAKIGDNEIDSEHYAAGSIDNEHMAANSIDSDQYVDGSIDNEHLANNAVDTDELAANAVTLAKMDNTAKTIPLTYALGDETTAVTTGTAKITFRMPYAFTLTGVRASLTGAGSTSGTTTVDINEGGTTILSTKLTIDQGEKTSTTAAAAAVISDASLADDAEITIDVDAVTGGADETGLKVTLLGYPT